jgi:4-hydroxy 2-oxovalerate aldolase
MASRAGYQMMASQVTILDCTLRDGSYVVHQRFTADDTARVCAELEAGGVRQIEIGHGAGLGASGPRHGIAAASDKDHIEAASRTLQKARFGTFYIPGVGSTNDLDMARDHGMHFVRVGTTADQCKAAWAHIEYARRIGFDVFYSAMKSYLATPAALLAAIRTAVECGAQAAYVVDSAGALIPIEVKAYVEVLTSELDVPIGFHGHNNFMLANANCLAAWEAGATFFDGTLQGIGRSGGNAQTEILAIMFEKMKVDTGLNVRYLLDAGERLIRPFMNVETGGATALNVVIGMAGFHSTYLDRVNSAARQHGVDLKDLIIAVCKYDRVDPSSALIERVASDLASRAQKMA